MKIIAKSKETPIIEIVVSELGESKFNGVVFKSNRSEIKVGYSSSWNRAMFNLFYDNKTHIIPITNTIISSIQEVENLKHNGLKQKPKSILNEAEKIVNGDRNEQYGDPLKAFQEYSNILETNFGIKLTPSEICKVQMAIKLGRMKYKHKRDSVVDLCGYAEILNRLENGI